MHGFRDVMALHLSPGSKEELIVGKFGYCEKPVWSFNEKWIVFSEGFSSLFQVPTSGGEPIRITSADNSANMPHSSLDSNRLVYSNEEWKTDIYRMALGTPQSTPERVIDSTVRDFNAQISPHGDALVFSTNRNGYFQIWIASSNGSNPKPLTESRYQFACCSSWSPDGSEIAFTALIDGNWDIYTVSREGGTPNRFTTHSAHEGRPTYTPDGKNIYFYSDREDRREIWKQSKRGKPNPQRITYGGGYDVRVNSLSIFYTRTFDDPGLWISDLNGHGAEPIQGLGDVRSGMWALTSDAIYWAHKKDAGYEVFRYDLKSRAKDLAPLAIFSADIWDTPPVISVSADGKMLFWHATDYHESDLVLLNDLF